MRRIKRSNKTIFALITFCVAFALLFFGYVDGAKAQSPRYGGILRIVVQEPFSLGFPGTMTGQTDGQTSSAVLETLFRFDEAGNFVPLLATDYKTDPAAKTITIALRKGVKFHDGSDFNAEIAKWNMETYKAQNRRPELNKVGSIDVIDSHTIRLNLVTFDNTMLMSLANAADAGRMMSKKAFDDHGREWCEFHPVGTGPFQFESREKDAFIKYKRFDGYWGGKPYLDGIDNLIIQDDTVALMAFKSGKLDIYNPRQTLNAKNLEKEGKYNMVRRPMGQVPALCGYVKDPESPFTKLKVRQAMSYAVNVNALAEGFGMGYWKIQNQWAIPGTWGYNNDIKGYDYNPEKAKQLLAEAGYPNGFKTTLNFFNFGKNYVDEMTAIQRFLKEVGIDGELNGVKRNGFVDMASLGKGWVGVCRMQGYSSLDPLVKYANYAAGKEFAGGYIPPGFKELWDRATRAPDFETKKRLTHELMKMSVDGCIATHLYVKMSPIFKTKKLHDDLYGEVAYAYLSPKAWMEE
jgi:peptide/nickel transport system substrate-binding protein